MHSLAMQLGCFVEDIESRMSLDEYENWFKYFAEQSGGVSDDQPIDLEKMSPEQAKKAIGIG